MVTLIDDDREKIIKGISEQIRDFDRPVFGAMVALVAPEGIATLTCNLESDDPVRLMATILVAICRGPEEAKNAIDQLLIDMGEVDVH